MCFNEDNTPLQSITELGNWPWILIFTASRGQTSILVAIPAPKPATICDRVGWVMDIVLQVQVRHPLKNKYKKLKLYQELMVL